MINIRYSFRRLVQLYWCSLIYLTAATVLIGLSTAEQPMHIVLGVNLRGEKEVLGLWLAENEGTKLWLSVLTELRQRGVQNIYIASMDGLKGLPDEAAAGVAEQGDAQVHAQSMDFFERRLGTEITISGRP